MGIFCLEALKPFLLRCFSSIEDRGLYSLWRYTDANGRFDYALYKAAQEEANRRKIDCVWVQKENICFLSTYISRVLPELRFGLCHGTRRGLEQQWFREQLNCDVIGTEISSTASQFPYTIQWDFHEVKDEWLGKVDFIYSNSLDHSYDPEACLTNWMRCLSPHGVCILEYSDGHEKAKRSDPFGASIFHMPYLILRWGKGAFSVQEVLDAPVPSRFKAEKYPAQFLIVRNHS
jgi:hypothetical protein